MGDSQRGLIALPIIIGLIVFAVVGGGAYYGYTQRNLQSSENPTNSTLPSPSVTESPTPTVSTQVKVSTTPKSSVKASSSPSSSAAKYSYTCEIRPDKTEGTKPLIVQFYTGASYPPGSNGLMKEVQWDYNGDGTWDTNYQTLGDNRFSYTYSNEGNYTVRMQGKTADGVVSNVCTKDIKVGGTKVACSVHSDKEGMSNLQAPVTANFYYAASTYGGDAGYVTDVQWDFDGNGSWDTPFSTSSQKPSYTYTNPGTYHVKMQLRTSGGYTSDVCEGLIVANI